MWSQPFCAFQRLELLQRRARDQRVRRVARVEVLEEPGRDLVGPRRAARAALLPVGAEHEVVDDQLPAALEQVGQPDLALRAGEAVVLGHLDHRQPAALGAQRVAAAGQLLLLLEQRRAGGEPLVPGHDLWKAHGNRVPAWSCRNRRLWRPTSGCRPSSRPARTSSISRSGRPGCRCCPRSPSGWRRARAATATARSPGRPRRVRRRRATSSAAASRRTPAGSCSRPAASRCCTRSCRRCRATSCSRRRAGSATPRTRRWPASA